METLLTFYCPDGFTEKSLKRGLKLLDDIPNKKVADTIIQYIVDHYSVHEIEKNFSLSTYSDLFFDKLRAKNPTSLLEISHRSLLEAYEFSGQPGEYEWTVGILNNNCKVIPFLLKTLTYYQDDSYIKNLTIKNLLTLNEPLLTDYVKNFQDEKKMFFDLFANLTPLNCAPLLELLQKNNDRLLDITFEHVEKLIKMVQGFRREDHLSQSNQFLLLSFILNNRPEFAIQWYDHCPSHYRVYVLLSCQHPNLFHWLSLSGEKVSVRAHKLLLMSMWQKQLDNLLTITETINFGWTSNKENKAMVTIFEKAIEYGNTCDEQCFKHPFLQSKIDERTIQSYKFLGVKRQNFLLSLLENETLVLSHGIRQYAEKKFAGKKKTFKWDDHALSLTEEIDILL